MTAEDASPSCAAIALATSAAFPGSPSETVMSTWVESRGATATTWSRSSSGVTPRSRSAITWARIGVVVARLA